MQQNKVKVNFTFALPSPPLHTIQIRAHQNKITMIKFCVIRMAICQYNDYLVQVYTILWQFAVVCVCGGVRDESEIFAIVLVDYTTVFFLANKRS